MFHQQSYDRHGKWYNHHYPTEANKIAHYRSITANTVSEWLQRIFFSCVDPLLTLPAQQWLTVGDAYGLDAQYILSRGSNAMATDLNTDFLRVAKAENIIREYAGENAEKLSFNDNKFDFVLCKESYHHFPRPYAALYEMIRVAKKGIVIIEPQDPVSKMPLLLLITNLLAKSPHFLSRIWKNRFSYEPVGNFVYKVSEREFEKFAAGLNLPVLAFKRINPNFYFKGTENIQADSNDIRFLSIRVRKKISDILAGLKIFPGQVLSAVIFKQIPGDDLLQQLRASGYRIVRIPKNPYLKNTL